MKTVLFSLSIILFSNFPVFAQFPVTTFYPVGVMGNTDIERLLNKKEILAREHIREVHTQTSPKVYEIFTSKNMFINRDGNIDSVVMCFSKPNKIDSGFYNTQYYFYDSLEHFIELRVYDKENFGSKIIYDYTVKDAVKIRTIDLTNSHEFIQYKFFNQKGQFIKSKQIVNGVEGSNTLLYYHVDGLPDSIKYENSNLATNIFKRTKKRDLKIIEMENTDAKFKWIYNSSDQCILNFIFTKNNLNSSPGKGGRYSSKTKVNYYYNLDGTLSKVTEKNAGKPMHATVYSYSK